MNTPTLLILTAVSTLALTACDRPRERVIEHDTTVIHDAPPVAADRQDRGDDRPAERPDDRQLAAPKDDRGDSAIPDRAPAVTGDSRALDRRPDHPGSTPREKPTPPDARP